jgi:type IV pilus assembly protein PilQ
MLRRRWLASCAVLSLLLSACAMAPEKTPSRPTAAPAPAAKSAGPAPSSGVSAFALSLQDLSVREERGQTVMVAKFSQPVPQFRHFPLPNPARIVLDIFGSVRQPGQTESYRIDTSMVATLRAAQVEGGLRLSADIAAATVPPYTITPEDGGLRIVIGAENPNATAKKDVTIVRGGVRADIRTAEGAGAKTLGTDKITGEEKKYTGEKISLDFKDADIKNVFRLLAEVSGKNLVVTDEVSKKVTIRLIEVPWDQALDLIIETNGLAKEETGNVVRISTAARLSQEKREQQNARNASRSAEIPQLSYLTVNYAKAKDLAEKVKLLIKGGAEVVPDERSNFIVVRGSKMDLEEVVAIVTRLDVRTPQVLIESNVIETTPSFSRAFGAEVDFDINRGIRADSRFLAGEPFSGSLTPFSPTPGLPTAIPLPDQGFRFGVFQNRFGPFRNLNVALTAAEQKGLAKIISRPSIVTLNNIESQIESVKIVRVLTSAATVGEAGSIREFKVGITLTVTPQVSADGFILMKIEVKSSSLDRSSPVTGLPQEDARQAKANVLVRDGETVVIGGILKDDSSDSETGIPFIKDIPVIGWLFKKATWRKDFQELMVFITPRIIQAGSENLPSAEQLWREQMKQTDGTAPPSLPPFQP